MRYHIPVDSPPGTKCLIQSPGGGCYDGQNATVLATVNEYGATYEDTKYDPLWRGNCFKLKFDQSIDIGAGMLITKDSLPMSWCFVPNCPVNYWLKPRKKEKQHEDT